MLICCNSISTMPGRGKHVKSIAKTIIYNVYKYFEKETTKSKYRGPPKLTHKTAEATGYGERMVRRIIAEKTALSEAVFSSPDRERVDVDDFVMEALRRTVHGFYRDKKYPTLDSSLVAVKEKGDFTGERTTLWKVLRKMGFKHKKVNDKQYIYEQPRIFVQRHEYLGA